MGDDAAAAGRDSTLTWHTADACLEAAERLMLVAELPRWSRYA